jgi:ethanolaminephosphotransferase
MNNYVTGDFITEEGLTDIKNHKYNAGGYSILDNVMNPYWEFVVTLMPKTLAPNAITLLGVIINFAMYGSMFYYDRTMAEDVPSWTYSAVGIGMFMYQTLDAIDGKQARRTGSSSPLGQLFDHGCDVFS